MMASKKFDIKVSEKKNGWCAEITRQVTSRRTMVSKRETGFETEEKAMEWAKAALAEFVENQAKRNERKAEKRSEREAAALEAEAKAAAAKALRAARDAEMEDEE
ncbi:DUF3622 domain-containing protein [Vibrio sp. SCSIO 43136]|uniref:DUF3622 domain-containing protein n=1 Tax=Vibrio sp. SCSIO 43136 TaxID=2819101 RepID=UPI002074B1D7|nr:DUF3622 domain-containing protein [Vibrio sp. SCSIO 43136]USD66619.1 DUF3622 domain-containing protein [Vibrio sp. SCSIO 43136]